MDPNLYTGEMFHNIPKGAKNGIQVGITLHANKVVKISFFLSVNKEIVKSGFWVSIFLFFFAF
jgi:hypothetical protein